MGKKSSDPPQAPDPAASIAEQQRVNRINQFTPQGNLVFGTSVGNPDNQEFLTNTRRIQTGTRQEQRGPRGLVDVPVFETITERTVNPNFDPNAPAFTFQQTEGQAASQLQESDAQRDVRLLTEDTARNLGQQALQTSESLPQDPLTAEGLPELLQGTVGDDTRRVEQAIFDRGRGLLDPVFDRREEDLRQSLANRGQPLGFGGAGERTAANAELELFGLERGNAFNNLANDAIRGAGAEQSRQFGVSSAARGQLFNERAATRSNRFNELASLLGIQPVQQAQQGQFFAPGSVDVVGPQNTAFQGQLNAFNNQQANRSSALGGLFQLGGTVAGGIFGGPLGASAGGALGGALGGGIG